jgi:protein FRA10AC1
MFHESDLNVLQANHQFIRDDDFDEENKDDWKIRMSRKYYDQLYKEIAIADLSLSKEGKIGIRWRTEQEVINKKGTNICGEKRCSQYKNLKTFELPFKYVEMSKNKTELVKLKLCPTCSEKLHSIPHKIVVDNDVNVDDSITTKKTRKI